jgi:hypothetical protein
VRGGKTPIRIAAGTVIGIFGMYELGDHKAANEIMFARNRAEKSQKA